MRIVLVGYSGAGKDSVCNRLVDKHFFQKFSINQLIADHTEHIFDSSRKWPFTKEQAENNFKDGMKAYFNPLIFCQLIKDQTLKYQNVVISDLTTIEEIKFMEPDQVWLVKKDMGMLENFKFDFILNNKGTMAELYSQVDIALRGPNVKQGTIRGYRISKSQSSEE
jgi:GTPase SAR1 family protein